MKCVLLCLCLCFVYTAFYSWGLNSNGQLGLNDTTNRLYPTLASFKNIKYLHNGYSFTFYIDIFGQFFVYGANSFYQLGTGDNTTKTAPFFNSFLSGLNVSLITSGKTHSIIFANNFLYGFGFNQFGQIGLGHNAPVTTPSIIPFFNNTNIKFVDSGYDHVIVVTTNNTVYSWGLNNYGQLGLSNFINQNVPNLISFFNNQNVSILACGGDTSYIYLQGAFYAWGFNSGKYGNGASVSFGTPTLISNFNNINIVKISSGGFHTMILDNLGIVYVMGSNNFGQLGIPGSSLTSQSIIPFFSGIKVDNIYATDTSSFVATSDIRMFGFGNNMNGILGINNTFFQFLPVEITSLTGNFNPQNQIISKMSQHISFVPDYDCFGFNFNDTNVCGGMGVCYSLNNCVCNQGAYLNGKVCVQCPTGTYNPQIGATSISLCLKCPSNSYSVYSSCIQCNPGFYLNNQQNCQPCPVGTYNPNVGSVNISSCIFCGIGTYNDKQGATNCKICKSGCYGGSLFDGEDALANTTSSTILDPMDEMSKNNEYTSSIIKYTKFSAFFAMIIPLVIIFLIIWCISYKTSKTPVLDCLFSEQRIIQNRKFRDKKKTRLGECCSGMVVIFFIIFVSLNVVDFFFINKSTRRAFELTKSGNATINIGFSLNISNGYSYCNNTNMTIQNVKPNNSYFYKNINTTTCNIQYYCDNCLILGPEQQICYNFGGNSVVYTNSFLYSLYMNSVIEDKYYYLYGSVVPASNVFYSKDPTVIYFSIFPTRFKALALGYFTAVYHIFDLFIVLPDYIYKGYSGTYIGVVPQSNNQMIQDQNGFSVCFNIRVASNLYNIEENINTSFFQLISIIASTTAAIFFVFKNSFKVTNWVHTRWVKQSNAYKKIFKKKANPDSSTVIMHELKETEPKKRNSEIMNTMKYSVDDVSDSEYKNNVDNKTVIKN